MPSYNRVILIGRLTRDPELRYTSGGLAIAKFSLAVDRRFKNQQGERVTDFFDCSAFRQTAEFVTNYVTKGRLVAVDGRVELNQSTGQDGQKRYFTNIVCDTVETLDSQRDSSDAAPAAGSATGAGSAGGVARGASAAPDSAPDSDNGYFPDDDAAPPPPRPQGRAMAAAAGPAAASSGNAGSNAAASAGAGGASRGAAPAGGRPQPAPAYPEDDFDDSDPFADQ